MMNVVQIETAELGAERLRQKWWGRPLMPQRHQHQRVGGPRGLRAEVAEVAEVVVPRLPPAQAKE